MISNHTTYMGEPHQLSSGNMKRSFKITFIPAMQNSGVQTDMPDNEKIKAPMTLNIMSDGGSENKGVDDFITELKADHSISHIIAQIDVPYSNSMTEADNYMLKYYGLYHLHVSDFESLQKILPQVVDNYNRRPNNVLDGLTPEEFLNGIPKEEVFAIAKNPITKAIRIAENKSMRCCLSKK